MLETQGAQAMFTRVLWKFIILTFWGMLKKVG